MLKCTNKKVMSIILSIGFAVGCVFAVPSSHVFADEEVVINETNFPDAAFRQYVSDNFDTSDPKDGKLSSSEINAVTEIEMQQMNVTSLKGVEYFINLDSLVCTYGSFESVDVSKNTNLTHLCLMFDKLISLDVSKNTNLLLLDCWGNQLTKLDVSKNIKLQSLVCDGNQLTSLDVSKNTDLHTLYCNENQLTSLNVSNNKSLQDLECSRNKLTGLDISKNTILSFLDCEMNKITSLDISKNSKMTHLSCWLNDIPTLDVSNTPLKTVENGYKTVYQDSIALQPSSTVYSPYLRYGNYTTVIYSKPTNDSSGSNSSNHNNTNQNSSKKETKKYSNEWVNGKWYNADGSQTYKGTMSWKKNSTGWWIEDSAGWYPTSKWQKIDGKWYYFTADGYMDYSEYRDGYWLGSDGAWIESYSGGKWSVDGTGWWYSDSSGWYPANQWLWIDGTNYHFNAKGYCTNP